MKIIQLQLNWLSHCVFKASSVDSDCLFYRPIWLARKFSASGTFHLSYILKKSCTIPIQLLSMFTTTCCRRWLHNVRYCQAASRRDCNGCRQEPGTTQTKGASGSRHSYFLRYANHSWRLSPEWWIFPSAPILALVSDTQKLSIVLSLMIFFPFKLETALPQARSFQPVACPINSAPSPTKFNTACPSPDMSALSFIKSIIASLQLLATDSHCECELVHSMDMISPFPESYFFSVLGQVNGVCLFRQNVLPEVDGMAACSQCACVRACTITITAEADPVQVSS